MVKEGFLGEEDQLRNEAPGQAQLEESARLVSLAAALKKVQWLSVQEAGQNELGGSSGL
jgi:hypothetical protein